MKRRKKKVYKLRGNHTHGFGSKKKHRGSGNRGGFGMAGTGKRADTKKPSINPTEYFGKHGFISIKKLKQKVNVINVDQLSGLEAKNGVIDLASLGYTKLLGSGLLDKKLKVIVMSASANAVEKVQALGGSVELLQKKQEEKAAQPEAKQEAKPKQQKPAAKPSVKPAAKPSAEKA